MIRNMGGIRKNKDTPVSISNRDKAEMLAKAFVKIHSNENLSEEERNSREIVKRENPDVLEKCNGIESSMYVLSLFKL